MTLLDLLVLAVLAFGLVRGLGTGAIRQVAGIFGLLVAFVLSVELMHPVGEMLMESFRISPDVAPLVGFVLVFMVVQLAVYVLVRVVQGIIGALKLSVIDRVFGGAVGAFKAALLLSVVFLVLDRMGFPDEDTREASSFYDPIAGALPAAWDYVSEQLPQVQALSEAFGDRVESELSGSSDER